MRSLFRKFAMACPGVADTLRHLRPKYAQRRRRLAAQTPEQVFTDIYESGHWDDEESASGSGSTRDAAKVLSAQLPGLVEELSVRVFVDAPCGDFNWMQHVELGVDQYIGGDIVPALVEKLQAEYGGPGRSFQVLNLITDELPEADLLFCRDCMLHLSFANLKKLLENVQSSSCNYLMASTYPDVQRNLDIVTGEARPLNMRLAPFSLPKPVKVVDDPGFKVRNRVMGVWSREQLGAWRWGG